ncbi:histidinol-phosphate aminotransferase (plasmid) [Allorhizobium ampelinum S4]|uniref:Histidinol-phosphate aminotransferase n=1 Tax=Allorhizobium ampelinum (strain ATCC BAA-846 / DSM 112012 / S4) TaxID=311402 RepID=B9K379_ALLAM|nr:histidinol-phosphate transaminase [Allorhizobium ampelinum]ACM39327.1 histidinol-phosphate aminotransferase [Allorhizobium ampelinum S4]
MSNSCQLVFPSHIERLPRYRPAADLAVVSETSAEPLVNLASNENPYGTNPGFADALNEITRFNLAEYPDPDALRLKTAIAAKNHVSIDQLIIANGSDELIDLSARTLLAPGTNAIFDEYSFVAYRKATYLAGATGVSVRPSGWNADLNEMLRVIDTNTRMIFLANPSNPTPGFISTAEFDSFISRVPATVLVVLDEAYIDFVEPNERIDCKLLLQSRSNVFITRTFSKAYGLAGVRVGYGIGSPTLINMMNRIRQPFSVGVLPQLAAVNALANEGFVNETRAKNIEQKARLSEGLSDLGIEHAASKGNFIIVKLRAPSAAHEALQAKRILVRRLASYGLSDWLRLTIGTESQNRIVLDAFRTLTQQAN